MFEAARQRSNQSDSPPQGEFFHPFRSDEILNAKLSPTLRLGGRLSEA